jgi:hypothetical protein
MRHEPTPSQDAEARPFPLATTPIHVPDEVLADLRRRLELTRWPDDAGNQDWYYGVNRGYLQELVDYWRSDYDWRKVEARINAYEHYRVEVEGVPVHLMRRPGVGPDPTPLLLTHGWPWTFWHWAKVVDPLADPAAHGGDAAEAFEVIVPSFPGFGFSSPLPENPDMNFWRVADLWHTLMTRGPQRAPKSAGQRPSSSCLACCPNHAGQPGLPAVTRVRLTTVFGGEIRPGRGRREIILVG